MNDKLPIIVEINGLKVTVFDINTLIEFLQRMSEIGQEMQKAAWN